MYVIKDLKVDILLEMNTMTKEMMQIDLRTNSLIIKGKEAPLTYSKVAIISFHASIQLLMFKLTTQKACYTVTFTASAAAFNVSAASAAPAAAAAPAAFTPTCRHCKEQFALKNRLYQHLRAAHWNGPPPLPPPPVQQAPPSPNPHLPASLNLTPPRQPTCRQQFTSKNCLHQHLHAVHPKTT